LVAPWPRRRADASVSLPAVRTKRRGHSACRGSPSQPKANPPQGASPRMRRLSAPACHRFDASFRLLATRDRALAPRQNTRRGGRKWPSSVGASAGRGRKIRRSAGRLTKLSPGCPGWRRPVCSRVVPWPLILSVNTPIVPCSSPHPRPAALAPSWPSANRQGLLRQRTAGTGCVLAAAGHPHAEPDCGAPHGSETYTREGQTYRYLTSEGPSS